MDNKESIDDLMNLKNKENIVDAFGNIDPRFIAECDDYEDELLQRNINKRNKIVIFARSLAAIIPIVLVITVGIFLIRNTELAELFLSDGEMIHCGTSNDENECHNSSDACEEEMGHEMETSYNEIENVTPSVDSNGMSAEGNIKGNRVVFFYVIRNQSNDCSLSGYYVDEKGNKYSFDFSDNGEGENVITVSDLKDMSEVFAVYKEIEKSFIDEEEYEEGYFKDKIENICDNIRELENDGEYIKEIINDDDNENYQVALYVVRDDNTESVCEDDIIMISLYGEELVKLNDIHAEMISSLIG